MEGEMKLTLCIVLLLVVSVLLIGCGGTIEQKTRDFRVANPGASLYSAWTNPGNYFLAIYPDGAMLLSVRVIGSEWSHFVLRELPEEGLE